MAPLPRFSRLTASVLMVLAAACGGTASSSGTSSSSSGGTSGTSGDFTTDQHIDPTPFPKTCSMGLAGLLPNRAFDSIDVRVTGEPLGPLIDGGTPAPYTVLESRGSACAAAKDKVACKAAFDAATVTTSGWSTNAGYRGGAAPPPNRYGFYVVTRADAVVIIATTKDLVAFIAPIDSVTEAIHVRGGPLGAACPRVRADADGYSFFDEGCGPPTQSAYTTTEIVTKVGRDGSVATTETAGPFPDPTNGCAPAP